MNFKKFVTSLAVSTMLVGSQAAVSGAMEKSPKTEVSQKANSEGRGVVKTVLNCIPGLAGAVNGVINGLAVSGKVDAAKSSFVAVIIKNDLANKSTFVMDGLLIVYSVAQFLV